MNIILRHTYNSIAKFQIINLLILIGICCVFLKVNCTLSHRDTLMNQIWLTLWLQKTCGITVQCMYQEAVTPWWHMYQGVNWQHLGKYENSLVIHSPGSHFGGFSNFKPSPLPLGTIILKTIKFLIKLLRTSVFSLTILHILHISDWLFDWWFWIWVCMYIHKNLRKLKSL